MKTTYALVVVVFLGVIVAAYCFRWEWTGLYVPEPKVAGTWKTLWDWLELLVIPAVLAIATLFFNKGENRRSENQANARAVLERESAKERWEEAILDDYLARMSDLLLTKGLRTRFTESDEPLTGEAAGRDISSRGIAKALTLMALRRLNSVERRNVVTRFLGQVGLLLADASLLAQAELDDMDLKEVELNGANLRNAWISNSNLGGAALLRARLYGVDLSGSDLSGAILIEAGLQHARLENANLTNAQLQGADLTNANLSGANLTRANLSGANFTKANLLGADLRDADLRGATLTKASLEDAENVSSTIQGPRL